MKVKICGLTRVEDIDAVNACRPDYAGFVFAESKRRVTPEEAAALIGRLAPGILSVGVFAGWDEKKIRATVSECGGLDFIQLHGSEDEDFIREVKALTGKPVIKAIFVSSPRDIEKWNASAADFLLLDSGGGTGRRFDWRLIGETDKPFFLAGGLNAENISEAIEKVSPYAVDVSSGVETGGYKDGTKLAEFIKIVRRAL